MVEYDEKGKLVIPEKETQTETKKPQSTEQAVTQLLDKKKQITETNTKQTKQKATKTKVKTKNNLVRRKPVSNDEKVEVKRQYWRDYYNKRKDDYKRWSRLYRERKQKEKLEVQKKSKKQTSKATQ